MLARTFAKRIAALCLLLTLWSGIALITHQHSSKTESARCTVCVTAHSASPKSSSVVHAATFFRVSAIRIETHSAKQRTLAFSLNVRPPPQA